MYGRYHTTILFEGRLSILDHLHMISIMCPETTAWKLLLSKEGHCSPQETGTALPNYKRNVPTTPKALELVGK